MSAEIFAKWNSDPEFVRLPEGEKAQIYLNFFNKRNADDEEYAALPQKEKIRIQGNFLESRGLRLEQNFQEPRPSEPPQSFEESRPSEEALPAQTDPDMFMMEPPPKKRGFWEDPLTQIKEGTLHFAAEPARMAVDLAKIPVDLAGFAGGLFRDEGEDPNWLEKAANTSSKDLSKMSDDLSFVKPAFGVDVGPTALMTGLVGAGMRKWTAGKASDLVRKAVVPKGFTSSKVGESLTTTGVKSAFSGTSGDAVIWAAMQVTEPYIEKSDLSEATKNTIRGTVPLLLGIATGRTIEYKIDKILKNPLAVNIAKSYGKNADPKAVFKRWQDEGVFDNFKDIDPDTNISKGLGEKPGEIVPPIISKTPPETPIDTTRIVDEPKVGGRQGQGENVPPDAVEGGSAPPTALIKLKNGEVFEAEGTHLNVLQKHNIDPEDVVDTGMIDRKSGSEIWGGGEKVKGSDDIVGSTTSIKDAPAIMLPVSKLTLSDDVPNFKDNADSRGVVEPLQGPFEPLGTGPIVVWERLNGDLEVITGRHRLDLARRSGNNEILSQVVREKDGFTTDMAMTFDAESNIRDNQGSVKDYVNYFRNTDITSKEASGRGLLRADKGRTGFVIGKDAGDDLYYLFKAGKISKDKAREIASAAPKNEELQQLGITYAKNHTAEDTSNYLQAIQAIVPKARSAQGNLFGADEGWAIEADKMAKAASRMASGLRDEQRALRAASRLGGAKSQDFAKKYGIDPGDTEAINARLDEVGKEIVYMSKWASDPVLVDKVRAGAGLDAAEPGVREQMSLFGPPKFELTPGKLTKADKTSLAMSGAISKAKKVDLPPEGKSLTTPQKEGMGVGKQQGLFENEQGQIDIEFKPSEPLKGSTPELRQEVQMSDTGGTVRAASMVVRDMDEAASLLSKFRKAPQENLFFLTTDKNGKVLEVHHYAKGHKYGASVKVSESVGHVLNVPDAHTTYFAHNHPSGQPDSSSEDKLLMKGYEKVLGLNNIKLRSFVLGRDTWASINNPIPTPIKKTVEAPDGVEIPLRERGVLNRIPNVEEGEMLAGSLDARRVLQNTYQDREGFLLIDRQNRDVGFLPFVPGRKMKDITRDLISITEKTNATSVIFNSHKTIEPGTPRAKYLEDVAYELKGDPGLLDIIDPMGSHAESGRYVSGKRFAGQNVHRSDPKGITFQEAGSEQKLQLHPSTITGPGLGIAYGVNWDEAHDETGFHPERLKIDPIKFAAGAIGGAFTPKALKLGRRVTSSITQGYTKQADKVLDAFKELVDGMVVNENFRYALGKNRSQEFKDLFRTYKRDEARVRDSAIDLAKELVKIAPTKLEQKRLFQVLQGSITANKEFTAKAEVIRGKFDALRKDLQEYNLLNLSRFDKLTRKERANIRKELAGPDPAGTGFAGKQMTKPDLLTYADKLGVDVSTGASKETVIERIQGHLDTQRQRLHDYYHFGSAREYIPFYYDKFEGMSKKNLMNLQQEIKHYQKLSRKGTPEGKQEIEALVADLQNLAKTGKGKRGMAFKDMGLDLRYSWRRGNFDKKVQRMMGKIEEGAYATGKGLATQGSDVRKAKLFRDIADNPEWTMVRVKGERKPPSNFVEVKGKQYGELNGKFVRNDVWTDLKEVEEWRTERGRIYDQLLSAWKLGKAVLNPATQARNFASNVVLAYFGDVSPTDVKTYSKAAKALMDKKTNKFYKEAEEWGLYNDTFYSAEIGKLRDSLKSVRGDSDKMKNWIRDAMSLPGIAYQGNEKFFKTAVFIKARESGLSVDQAAKKAEEYLFNYADIPPWVKFGKRWVSPFLTFSYKAIPLYAKTAIRKPWKVGMIGAAMYGMEEYAKNRLGISDKEAKRERSQLPPWMRDKVPPVIGPHAHVLMPFKNKWGDNLYLDTSYILPYGNISETWGQSSIIPQILGPNNPLFTIPAAIGLNKDSFTGKDLFSKPVYDAVMKNGSTKMILEEHAKVLGKYLGYTWLQLTPSLMGYSGDKLYTGLTNMFNDKDPVLDWAERPQDMSTAIMSSLLGVKLTPANKKKLDKYTAKSVMRIRRELGMERGKIRAKKRRNEITDEEMREEIKASYKMERLLLKNLKTEVTR